MSELPVFSGYLMQGTHDTVVWQIFQIPHFVPVYIYYFFNLFFPSGKAYFFYPFGMDRHPGNLVTICLTSSIVKMQTVAPSSSILILEHLWNAEVLPVTNNLKLTRDYDTTDHYKEEVSAREIHEDMIRRREEEVKALRNDLCKLQAKAEVVLLLFFYLLNFMHVFLGWGRPTS